MSREIERERESTRPERENPTLSVPAFRRAGVARSPHACDPTVATNVAESGRKLELGGKQILEKRAIENEITYGDRKIL